MVRGESGRQLNYLKRSGLGIAVAAAVSFPFLYTDQYVLHILILCIIWSVVASAWNLILGYAGIISFGQLAFFTIGAYTVGIMNKYFNLSPWLGLILAGLFPAIIGLLIGIACLRLKGIYILLITLALQEIVPVLIKWQTRYTGGAVGFSDMPSLTIGGYNLGSNVVAFYLTALFFGAVFILIIYRIIKSDIGLAFVALRDLEDFARSLGINDYKYKVMVFIISASITGIMGALYGIYIGFASPTLSGWEYVIILLIAINLGGVGKFPGEILGTFFIIIANELLQGTSEVRDAVLGVSVILIIFLLPGGLVSLFSKFKRKEMKSPVPLEST